MTQEHDASKPAADADARIERTRCGRCYRPNCDILETADELLVVADLPGTTSEAIDVKFEEGTLAISAQVEPRQQDGVQLVLREYGVGDFYRTFEVSESIDVAKITAEYANGVLTLHLPKAESVKPRKIKVNA